MISFLGAMALVALAVCTCVLVARAGLPRVNPISIVTTAWAPALMLAATPGLLQPGLTAQSFSVMTSTFTVFATTTWIGFYATRRIRGVAQRKRPEKAGHYLSDNSLLTVHFILVGVLIAFAALQVWSLLPVFERLGGLDGLFSGKAVFLRSSQSALRAAQLGGGVTGGSLAVSLIGYVLFLGHSSLFTGAALWMRGRRVIATLPLAVLGALSLLLFARTLFVMGLLLFIATVVCLMQASERRRRLIMSRRLLLTAFGAGCAGFIILLLPLVLRNSGTKNSAGVDSLFQYVISGVGGLNSTIGSGVLEPLTGGGDLGQAGLGAFSFAGLMSIFARVGLPVLHPPLDASYVTIYINGGEFTTNIGTSLADAFLDGGGPIGMLVVVGIAGLSAGAVHSALIMRLRWWALPLAAWYFALLAWTFFGNVLTRDFRYVFLVLVASLCILVLRRFDVARTRGRHRRSPQTSLPEGQVEASRDRGVVAA